MNGKNNQLKVIMIFAGIAVLIFGIVFAGISLTKNLGKSKSVVSNENAEDTLNRLYKDIDINQVPARKALISLGTGNIKDSLPDISKYPPQVKNSTKDFIEIFSSIEKTGDNKDGWLKDTAKAFNTAGFKINGKTVSVRIRGIASGMGKDYIVSEKYVPDAFTPSNELWGEMIKASGININLAEKKLVGNVAGVLISKDKYNALIKKYGSINLKNITEAVAGNEIAMGYTDPFTSSTGLNFLISTLNTFDAKDPLGDKAIKGFEAFQNNIPFVANTTLQMKDAAASGSLDGFIMEYQTFTNSPDLTANYVFTPFGVRHDSPMYSIGTLSAEKKAILTKFLEFCKGSKYQKLASDDGFNRLDSYKPEIGTIKGDIIVRAQKLWKEKKNGSNNIAAVFAADVSGSMDGAPLNKLKQSLLKGSQYIGKDNSVGLVTFSNDVNINLPIAKFDVNQRSRFAGTVEDLKAGGNTAMFDAIIVASKMLMEEEAKDPNAKLMLFVLTDGETNYGHSLKDVEGIIRTLKIPVYTIGYNADIKVLQNLSGINEAASINADSDDVIYKLGSLFNSQM